jgi:chromosomal replication initiation ATPase DnaA
MKQLSLPFAEPASFDPADFIDAPSNALARRWLERPEGWTNGRLVLWGGPGHGKTFLAHIFGAPILRGADLRGFVPPTGPLAVDDADTVPDEAALLHLLNAAAEAGQPVLLTAAQPPSRQKIILPDLASRLRASLAVEIQPPEEALLTTLLTRLAAARQLTLNVQVQNFLLAHLPRTPGALREAVARLDRAALANSAKITRNLAATLLADLIRPAAAEAKMLPTRHAHDTDPLI